MDMRLRILTVFPGCIHRAAAPAILALGILACGTAEGKSAFAQAPANGSAENAPVSITLEVAIQRAEASEPAYAATKGASWSAQLDKSIAVAGLLPTARLFSQGIYTQPNGITSEGGEGVLSSDPKFVANDSRPHEYFAQGIVDETLSLSGLASVRRAQAAAAMAAAQQEIARRGLVAAVTALFYGSVAADHRVAIAQHGLQDAEQFTRTTEEREKQGEAAHADVIKAQLTQQQQWRSLQDAILNAQTARLDLAVLLFPDPRTPFTLLESQAESSLPPFGDVQAAAARNNPELKSALANLDVSNADLLGARAGYLPTLGLNVTYGIDANEFAVNGPMTPNGFQARNLGYSASWAVTLPVWDWLSTEHKVKQSEIRRDVARVALTATQRQLIANLQDDYASAQTAQKELESMDASVAAAAESLRLTKLRYTGGEASVLEVVDAQNTYLTMQNAREDGRVRYETALAALQTLTGTM